ncbi:putative CorA-like mg2+ transporter protein domain-containing protein [Seiridium unicorne]|uniref:CorA-like mg2+ transporter protein domain-containing protein n=1 Tax=Seiridium unicorne TaxID=138068 RepID=A0ABR2VEW2_9PEZI
MDWLRDDPYVDENDIDVYEFVPASSKVLLIAQNGKEQPCVMTWDLCTDEDWASWLENDPLILAQMPFSVQTYEKVSRAFLIHSSIVRVINRSTVAHCSYEMNAFGPANPGIIAYNCRSSASWPGDMALSTTYVPERRFSWAIYYGCTDSFIEKVIDQLEYSESPTFHPLTLSTVFVEHERNRHVDLVDDTVSGLMNRVLDIENGITHRTSVSLNYSSESKIKGCAAEVPKASAVTEWLKISHLRKGLENWKAQVSTLREHLSELHDNGGNQLRLPEDEQLQRFMARRSDRIGARLEQIMHEYDDRIRACSIATDGITFATQLEWNQIAAHDTKTNLAIANSTMEISQLTVGISKAAQQDSSQMKTIAILTMTFLPGTFVATLFSMSFFDWRNNTDTMMSPYIWIYIVVTAFLTLATIGIWRFAQIPLSTAKVFRV